MTDLVQRLTDADPFGVLGRRGAEYIADIVSAMGTGGDDAIAMAYRLADAYITVSGAASRLAEEAGYPEYTAVAAAEEIVRAIGHVLQGGPGILRSTAAKELLGLHAGGWLGPAFADLANPNGWTIRICPGIAVRVAPEGDAITIRGL